jgi:hypothetical protein
LDCKGPREKAGLCRTKMTNAKTQDKTGPRGQPGLGKISRTYRINRPDRIRRDQADRYC